MMKKCNDLAKPYLFQVMIMPAMGLLQGPSNTLLNWKYWELLRLKVHWR
ncbi:hypothetical protein M3182_00655 [Mesobacillus maritimus]|nr:hypothetical protein [Mesobacillus maritimus]MCM3584249.1 hypothetical protein [Mesobacillus maritimus]HWL26642.1 hypothetical protein [Ureibacillus sp.]